MNNEQIEKLLTSIAKALAVQVKINESDLRRPEHRDFKMLVKQIMIDVGLANTVVIDNPTSPQTAASAAVNMASVPQKQPSSSIIIVNEPEGLKRSLKHKSY